MLHTARIPFIFLSNLFFLFDKMTTRSGRALLAACFLFHVVAALRVSPNSPCLSVCVASDDESSSTSPSEIVCGDADVESTKEGKRFKTCLSCLEDSTHKEDGESDQGWFLCKCFDPTSLHMMEYDVNKTRQPEVHH